MTDRDVEKRWTGYLFAVAGDAKYGWAGTLPAATRYLPCPNYVFIGNLRKKLETAASGKSYILTEPWVGYRFGPGE